VEAIAQHHGTLGATFRLVTPEWAELEAVHDKRMLNALADAAGVARPATWTPSDETELAALPVEYPVIVKPAVSMQMQQAIGCKALLARGSQELVEQYRRANTAAGSDGLMVQELIPGRGESQFSVAAFCVEGRIVAAMTARRLRQYPYDFGLSSSFVEAVAVPGLIESAALLMGQTRISGMVEVEFKRDPRSGVFKLLDVNVRPWAWHSLCAACGLDFVLMQYRLAVGELVPAAQPDYGSRKWVRMVTDLPAVFQELRAGSLTLGGYLRSLRGSVSFSVLDLRDPLPMAGDIGVTAVRMLRRKLGRVRDSRAPSPDPAEVPA